MITEKSEAVFGGAIDNSGQKLVIIGYLFGGKYKETMIKIELLDPALAKNFDKDLDTTGYWDQRCLEQHNGSRLELAQRFSDLEIPKW